MKEVTVEQLCGALKEDEAITLEASGRGELYKKGSATPEFRWITYKEFVARIEGRILQAAKDRIVEAAVCCSRAHDSHDHATCPQLLCECDACLEYRAAIRAFQALGADDGG